MMKDNLHWRACLPPPARGHHLEDYEGYPCLGGLQAEAAPWSPAV